MTINFFFFFLMFTMHWGERNMQRYPGLVPYTDMLDAGIKRRVLL